MLVNTANGHAEAGKMAFLRPSENVTKVLELVGVSQVIPIYDDLNRDHEHEIISMYKMPNKSDNKLYIICGIMRA
jgi:hypothetical protein